MLTDRLIKRIQETRAPIVVGLDPRLGQIPEYIKEAVFAEMGRTPQAVAEIFYVFNKGIIDKIHDIVPAIKPQIAMYEQYGAAGLECYTRTIEYAQSKRLFVIGDIKRGDIASTAEAYSSWHIGRVNIAGENHDTATANYITVNPYMGFDSIEPYLADCREFDKGLFVLVKTSNAGSKDIQDIQTKDGKPVYVHVGELVSKWGEPLIGETGYSAIGAVVGATHPEEAVELRKLMPHTFFLVPGYGAQGGSGKDLQGLWDGEKYGAIVNSSRGITGAYSSGKFTANEKEYALAAREAALEMKADLEAYM
ncbi:MAG: orotidine-5'-phosphate decarboxylase [Defluviitaleaceae bacterium]|nr:orotidine-5'-phosphate decarboxylase [Defluviitaleaceae bacterium]MCL2262597.1 orotidine-5'-phosphate decarboxylase [Defluviitaleaceae bacterium]